MTTLSRITLFAATLAAASAAYAQSANLGAFEGAGDIGAPSHKGSVAYDAARKEYRITGAATICGACVTISSSSGRKSRAAW